MTQVLNNLKDPVFIRIATVSVANKLTEDSPLWDVWRDQVQNDCFIDETFMRDAYKFPEFGKIVCITVARIVDNKVQVKQYCDDDERLILLDFMQDFKQVATKLPNTTLCGWGIKSHEIPFIFKRCLVNGVEYHEVFDIGGVKPWEIRAVDLYEVWNTTSNRKANISSVANLFRLTYAGREFDSVRYWNTDMYGLHSIKGGNKKDLLTVVQIGVKCTMIKVITKPLIDRIHEGEDFELEEVADMVSTLDEGDMEEAKTILTALAGKRNNPLKKKDIEKLFNNA